MRWNRARWYSSGAAPKILLKISHFLFFIRDDLIRHLLRGPRSDCLRKAASQSTSQTCLAVEKNVIRLEQVVVTRDHLKIVIGISRRQFRMPGEELHAFGLGQGRFAVRNFSRNPPGSDALLSRNVHVVLKGALPNGGSACSLRSNAV